MPDFEIPDHYHSMFTTNVELLLQQRAPRFMGTVSMGSYSGESGQVVKQFGEVEFQERNTRNEDTTFADILHKQRWIYPDDYDLALPVDSIDEIRMLNSPQSSYVDAMRAAYARKVDDIVIGAFFSDAKTGKNGSKTTPFKAANTIAANAGATGATGLNVEKLIQARQKLKEAHVDLSAEMPHIAVTASQVSDLLRTVETTNADYSALKRLEAGEIDSFMGFKFVHTERLLTNGSGQRRLPVWVPSGIHFGTWKGLTTKIGERPDKKYITQVYMEFHAAATRTQEDKVFEIVCAE